VRKLGLRVKTLLSCCTKTLLSCCPRWTRTTITHLQRVVSCVRRQGNMLERTDSNCHLVVQSHTSLPLDDSPIIWYQQRQKGLTSSAPFCKSIPPHSPAFLQLFRAIFAEESNCQYQVGEVGVEPTQSISTP